jgi:hypothetical protein
VSIPRWVRDRWSDMQIRTLMRVPGVMDEYDGFMHGFHGIQVEGCDRSAHSGRAYEAGLSRGLTRREDVRAEQ